MTLDQFIIELLRKNNCVVVPEFGGFIANYSSAIIDPVKQKIYPPSKQILFNSKLVNNDGLLANHVTQSRVVSYPESIDFISQSVSEWRIQLKENKRIDFGEIGFLFEQDGVIKFEQNRDANLLLSAYGLSSIHFVSKNIEEVIEKSVTVVEKNEPVKPQTEPSFALEKNEKIVEGSNQEEEGKTAVVVPIEKPKRSRKRLGYIAAACVLPALFYSYWIPMETDFLDTGSIQVSDFNPFHAKEKINYSLRLSTNEFKAVEEEESFESKIESISEDVEIYNYQFDDELYIPVRLDKPEVVETETTSSIEGGSESAHIQLIAGCFSVKENAHTLITQLSEMGYNAYILDQNKGLYRVAAGGFSSVDEAKREKRILENKSIPTWILKR